MGKFKEYILREQIGLGNLGPKISNLANSDRLGGQIAGAFNSTDFTGTEQSPTHGYAGHPLHLPSTDLTIPQTVKSGRITTLFKTKNPIYVRLSDGTEAYFTYDEYRKIKEEPKVGKLMTIIFQKSPKDQTNMQSKIDKVIVR